MRKDGQPGFKAQRPLSGDKPIAACGAEPPQAPLSACTNEEALDRLGKHHPVPLGSGDGHFAEAPGPIGGRG